MSASAVSKHVPPLGRPNVGTDWANQRRGVNQFGTAQNLTDPTLNGGAEHQTKAGGPSSPNMSS